MLGLELSKDLNSGTEKDDLGARENGRGELVRNQEKVTELGQPVLGLQEENKG